MLLAARYRLDEPLGRGGMGEVWRARDEVLDRPVAVKLLLAASLDSSAAARFRQEAQATARLNHANVVAVHDFGEAEGRLYLVMELIDGRSLAEVGSVTPREVSRIGFQAASGLAAAHRQGVIHRDVKPGNLLLAADGTVKVVDFGIARLADQAATALTGTGLIVGTGSYLAPERALGRDAGPASDMYALGCVLYELLAGHPPFRADTLPALLYQHVQLAPVPPSRLRPDVPPALEDLLLSLLEKEPGARPGADQVAHSLATGSRTAGHAVPPSQAPPPQAPHGPAPTRTMPPLPHQELSSPIRPVPPVHPGVPAPTSVLSPLTAERTGGVGRAAWASMRPGRRKPVMAAAGVAVAAVVVLAVAALRPGTDVTGTAARPEISASPSAPPAPPSVTGSPEPTATASAVAESQEPLSDDPRVLLAQLAQALRLATVQGRLDPRVAADVQHKIAEARSSLAGRWDDRGKKKGHDARKAADRIRDVLHKLADAEEKGLLTRTPALTRLLVHISGLAGNDGPPRGRGDDEED
ncbi:serine/threonine protein kinase [Sphaerisporangium sp. NBC_01403]|uniref:protein kinase domain-containing protein n=1 Tax=Sphaerisporangium sp. NBC_01403 TaxID=2903599 RepID=UPI003249A0E0